MLASNRVNKMFRGPGPWWRRQPLWVLREVSLQILPSQVVCVVGESGCGKTTFGKIMAGLIPFQTGSITIDEMVNVDARHSAHQPEFLKVQMIHQDPFAALNPVHTVMEEMKLPLLMHHIVPKGQIRTEVEGLLQKVGLEPSTVLEKYPHELSGGQRQRVVIARALTVRPRYIVADEAVSMVDVSSRLILLDLLMTICQSEGIGVLFITHDFGVARYVAYENHGTIAVMYMGRIVEYGLTETIINHPQHPYTRILLSSIPALQAGNDYHIDKIQAKSDEVPTLAEVNQGCAFAARCPYSEPQCLAIVPQLTAVDDGEHAVACHVWARNLTQAG